MNAEETKEEDDKTPRRTAAKVIESIKAARDACRKDLESTELKIDALESERHQQISLVATLDLLLKENGEK